MNDTCLDPIGNLSARERQVFYELCAGGKNREIGARLHISPRTVETHRSRILKKLCFKNVVELVKFAIRNSLVMP